MKTHVADNLMLFRKYFNELYHSIRNQSRNNEKYQIVNSKSGQPNLCINEDHTEYNLHSTYDPVREAQTWAKQLLKDVQDAQQIIFYGIGLGYHLEAFIEHYPDKTIYLYEPELEILLAAMEVRSLERILKHNKIIVFGIGIEMLASGTFIQAFVEQVTQEHRIIISPGYFRPYAEEIRTFQKDIRDAVLRYRGNLHTFITFREEWPENIILNTARSLETAPIHYLRDVAKGKPVVVVGSGPSLDLDKDYLKTIAEHALIFAAGSSIQALLAHGIVPDMIFSIDGSEKNYQVFMDLDYEDIPMVYAPTIHHQIVQNKPKHLFHVVMKNDRISNYLLPDTSTKALFYSTTSVTGTVLQAASLFGCDPIILMGQDLSYPGGRVYSGKVDHFTPEEQLLQSKKATLRVENVQGGENEISRAMLNTLRDMEVAISIFNRDNRVINTSKLGARIKHTEFMPIEEVLQYVANTKLDKQIYYNKLIDLHDGHQSEVEIKDTLNKMVKTKGKLEKMKVDAEELLRLLRQLDSVPIKKLSAAVDSVNDLWLRIVRSQTFENVVSMSVETEIHTYKRYLPQILETTDMRKRSELIQKHMGMVVQSISLCIPKLLSYLTHSVDQIKFKHEDKGGL